MSKLEEEDHLVEGVEEDEVAPEAVEHRVEELQVEDEENVDFLLFTPVT
jgi:hypothetical protein